MVLFSECNFNDTISVNVHGVAIPGLIGNFYICRVSSVDVWFSFQSVTLMTRYQSVYNE